MITITNPNTEHLIEGVTTTDVPAWAGDQRATIPAGTPVVIDTEEDPQLARITADGMVAYLPYTQLPDHIEAA